MSDHADSAIPPDPLAPHVLAAIARHPADRIALLEGNLTASRHLTYGQLRRCVALFSERLLTRVRPGQLVLVCLPRSPQLAVSLLGCWHAGAVCTLLDPGLPDRALRARIQDLAPALVITSEVNDVRVSDIDGIPVYCPREIAVCPNAYTPKGGLFSPEQLDDKPASVLTSSHRPRTPESWVTHAQLRRACQSWSQVYGSSPTDHYFQTNTVSLDAFHTACLTTLTAGARLVTTTLRFDLALSPDFIDFLRAQSITTLDTDTGMARLLSGSLASQPTTCPELRLALVSGDRFFLDEHQALTKALWPTTRVLHVYRSAVATLDCCYLDLEDQPQLAQLPTETARQRCIVGVPFAGMLLELRPDPQSSGAEVLWVGGPLIGAKNASHMHSGLHAPASEWRSTGDIARRTDPALLEVVGSLSNHLPPLNALQVAETEIAFRKHASVVAGVLCKLTPVERRNRYQATAGLLRAYVQLTNIDEYDGEEILSSIKTSFPAESKLADVVFLNNLPLTRSGVIDRSQLSTRPPSTMANKAVWMPASRGKYGDSPGYWSLARPESPEEPKASFPWGFLLSSLSSAWVAWLLTKLLWPGSTDTSHVPAPWATHFHILYLFEYASFGVGLTYFFTGYKHLAALQRSTGLTVLTHMAITWLLTSWWPQDNMYRMTAATDWPDMAFLAWFYNITLMLCGAIVVRFVTRSNPPGTASDAAASAEDQALLP